MPTYAHISVERSLQDKIATITMRRPEVHNAFNTQLIQDLMTAFTDLVTDTQLHAGVLFVTGERFTSTHAQEIGLVHIVTKAADLDAAVSKTVSELLSGGPQAIRSCKALAVNVGQMDRDSARTYTAETIAKLRVSAEAQERLRAFLEKR